MKLLTILALLLLAAGAAPAQQPEITPETHVDTQTLHQWLHSGDPRLIAWAADFAQRSHNASILAEMPGVLENWTAPADPLVPTAPLIAKAAILDALIQENSQVPVEAIRAVPRQLSDQAVLLASRLPLSDSIALLVDWATDTDGALERVAKLILAKDPQATRGLWNQNGLGFVASVIAASEEHLTIAVSSKPEIAARTGEGGCGDTLGSRPYPAWPTVYGYQLAEGQPQAGDITVVDLDGDHIGVRRYGWWAAFGQCDGVPRVDGSMRHRLLAYWLGMPSTAINWQAEEDRNIVWTTKPAFDEERSELIRIEQEKLHDTVEALYQRGLLTAEEAAAVSPKLVVTVKCEIDPCPLRPGEYEISSK
jgi:hypothetical protein